MIALLRSTRWEFRILRIVLLVTVAWWVLRATNLVHAQLPVSVEWPRTDFSKTLVDLKEITSGGPSKDGIPSIDSPRFETPVQAQRWLDAREPVVAVVVAGKARAYPLQILIWHEIVNDEIAGVPLSVTFCPLCNATLVFDRRLGNRVLDFGTTGRLRKSDMVMYDRQTESWWQQFTGRGIVGELAGAELKRLPASIVSFADFRRAYPQGPVLSRNTGYRRGYGRNPYRGYDRVGDRPFLFHDPLDPRLPAMERVLNVTVGEQHTIFPFSALRAQPVINETVGDMPVAVFSRDGMLSVLDAENIPDSRAVPAATAFQRRLDGQILSFRLNGPKIVDEQTGTRWDLLGRAI
ncbi:MAG: hypothetical protein DRQ37_07315, partial [Gammaproteobacteria bacterium]